MTTENVTEGRTESESTRQLLMHAAKELFARQGFEGTTVKDIVDRAGVNVSMVSYYFQGKQGLYRTCLNEFGQSKLDKARRILQPPQSHDEFRVRLQMFFTETLEDFAQDPDLIRMINQACDQDTELTQDIFRDTFLVIFNTLAAFIEAGQKYGLMNKDLDSRMVASLTFGALSNQMRIDALNERLAGKTLKDPDYRKKVAEYLILQFSNGFIQKD